jgi:hypothetical protein
MTITLTREESQQVLDALTNSLALGAVRYEKAIETLRARLSAPEPVSIAYKLEPVAWMYALEYGKTVANKKVSLHQLNYPFGVCGADYLASNDDGISYVRQTPLYTTPPQPEPEPVAWMNEGDIGKTDWKVWAHGKPTATIPLYTAPPQREWQGLTDEEIMSLLSGAVRLPPGWSDTVQAIEAKLKEKNT